MQSGVDILTKNISGENGVGSISRLNFAWGRGGRRVWFLKILIFFSRSGTSLSKFYGMFFVFL